MSCLGFGNQPLPTKGVWKSLKLKLHTILRRRKSRRTRAFHRHRNFAPVYVDELYNEPEPAHVDRQESPWDDKEWKILEKGARNIGRFHPQFGDASSSSSSCSSFGPSLSAVVEMGEVDLREEMLIRKFKEEMRLQRQRSFGEYQEMLARGV